VNRAHKSCLIADDDPVYRDVASAALESAGYLITLASDGGEALVHLKNNAFDIAVVDLTMPIAGGLEVIKIARSGGLNAHTPIVVITGSDDADAVEAAFEIGATSFLTKPLNWALFTHHIDFVYRSGQSERELRDSSAASAFLSDLKSQTMRALARDFMRPVKTIFGFSEIIRREAYGPLEPQPYKDMVADMGTAAQTLNASLLKLMDLGASLNERLDLNEQIIPLADLVETAILGFYDKANRRSVALQMNSNIADTVTVNADQALLSQAVRSIIDNAVKLAPRGSTIEVNAGFSANGEFQLSATDFGPAISAELIAEVVGTTETAATLEVHASREIGIKIAKALAEVHNGRLNVRKTDNGANVVELSLPAIRFAKPATDPAPTAPSRTLLRTSSKPLSPTVTANLAAKIGEVLQQQQPR
jgi:two-component system, sensor histidine kinase and response regulator